MENLSPEMEQLIAENTALKQENADLREANKKLFDLVDNYDRELNDTTNMLKQTSDKLNEATEIIERFMTENDQPDATQGDKI
jgi:regulator of replication initiation timing